MKTALILVTALLCCAGLFAQTPAAEPPAALPNATPPVITFSQNWKDANPPYYSVVLDSAGNMAYRSTEQADNAGDPYELHFLASEETRTKVFDLAKQLDYFRGKYDYTKSRIAFTGTKRLRFQNGDENYSTTYNWSDNVAIQDLTKIFQNVSETIELGRILAEKYRFDRLGVDAIMRKLETASKDGRLAELQAIQPILTKVAKDTGMMNITRRRAEQLLAKIPQSARIAGRM